MIIDDQNSESSAEGLEDEVLDAVSDDDSENGQQDDESSKANKRTAEARINELSGRLKEQEDELKALRAKETVKTPMPPANNSTTSPEAQKVIEQLESLGFTRKEAIEEKLKTIEERIELNAEHMKLGNEYDGSDGRPKYNKSKVEGFMRDRGIFDPEAAYKIMNESELLDWNLKKVDAGSKKRPYVEKPGGSGVNRTSDTQITKEKLEEVSKNPTPANREWYERNRNKILQMMAEGQL